jgi:hypothetical protein
VRFRIIRNVAFGVSIACASAMFWYWLLILDPESEQLQVEQKYLKDQLKDRRAMARDLSAYRAEKERMGARVAEADRLLHPDLSVLQRSLTPLHVILAERPPKATGFYDAVGFDLSGADGKSLQGTMRALERTGFLFQIDELQQSASDWSMRVNAFHYIPGEKKRSWLDEIMTESKTSSAGAPSIAWSNQDLKRDIESKKRELRQLDKILGNVGTFMEQKRRLSEEIAISEKIRSASRDLSPLVGPLFADSNALFESGHAYFDEAGLRVEGVKGRAWDHAKLTQLLEGRFVLGDEKQEGHLTLIAASFKPAPVP